MEKAASLLNLVAASPVPIALTQKRNESQGGAAVLEHIVAPIPIPISTLLLMEGLAVRSGKRTRMRGIRKLRFDHQILSGIRNKTWIWTYLDVASVDVVDIGTARAVDRFLSLVLAVRLRFPVLGHDLSRMILVFRRRELFFPPSLTYGDASN